MQDVWHSMRARRASKKDGNTNVTERLNFLLLTQDTEHSWEDRQLFLIKTALQTAARMSSSLTKTQKRCLLNDTICQLKVILDMSYPNLSPWDEFSTAWCEVTSDIFEKNEYIATRKTNIEAKKLKEAYHDPDSKSYDLWMVLLASVNW